MDKKISVVINAFNEEQNIERALESVKWASEVVVCDMNSTDKTAEVAKKKGAKVFYHKTVGFVEPARNFAISKATGDWILILDADEEIPQSLSKRLQELVKKKITSDFVEIPRKNIIFNKWIQNTGWWPDYQIRFFRKGSVHWNNKIHSKPDTKGAGLTLDSEEKLAILHNNYQTVALYLDRMNRYTEIQAEDLVKSGYRFNWHDIFEKPFTEFLSRYFANYGYKDGLHGLSLSLLQGFSFLVVYLKVWQKTEFKEQDLEIKSFEDQAKKIGQDITFWINQSNKPRGLKKFFKIFKK